ncbi:MAG: hypothetical protein IT473_02875 [Lysobacter sp.]|nr:hypothetical protein [Lysobacter sp.]
MTRKIGSLPLLAGIALLALLAGLIILSRSGENELLSGPWRNAFGHPLPATVDEQREFMRLSLLTLLESPGRRRAGVAPRTVVATSPGATRLALNAIPSRLCNEIPQLHTCTPNASGRSLISETPPPNAKKFERLPIALRRALVQAKPVSKYLPDPGVPGVVVYNDGAPLPAEKERLVRALFRGEVKGGLGHYLATWAVVSVDGQTALMDVTATGATDTGGYAAIEVFKRDPGGWRLAERLTY